MTRTSRGSRHWRWVLPAFASITCSWQAIAQTPQLPSPTSPSLLRIDAGGAAVGSWTADQGFSTPSSVNSTTTPVTTSLVNLPAPQPVYQSERYGTFTYTISKLVAGATYPVDLHFNEFHWTMPKQREFNVAINGTPVLTDFDIVAEAGGPNIALVRSFPVVASSTGTIAIAFSNGDADVAKISGIDVHMPLQPAVAFTSGAIFTLMSAASTMDLDDNNTTTAGTPVTQWGPALANTNQQWLVSLLPGGVYNLISLSNRMALDTAGQTTAGASVAQNFPLPTSVSQQWKITAFGDGTYQLASAATGFVLDSSAGGQGSPVLQSAATGVSSQHWKLSPVQIGANTPFISYEAEAGILGGGATVVSLTAPPTNMFSTPQLEASGHAYVHLAATSQSVSWTNNTGKAITALNVRYSIPDAVTGGGITSTLDLYVNNVLRQAIPVNSMQTWEYESPSSYDSASEDPTTGTPHVFWDETHLFIPGAAVAPGDTIKLQKDSANTAAYFNIDVVDLETPPAPIPQPANSLSIVTYGAVANNVAVDSTAAIQNAIADAETKGMSVYIPQGIFYIESDTNIQPHNITIQGAGMWYSTLYFKMPATYQRHDNVLNPYSSILMDFRVDSNAANASQDSYGLNIKGSNWVVDRIWLEHLGPEIWADGENGIVRNSRVDSGWADGCNINNGDNSGINLSAMNNFFRGMGDDGMAINDAAGPDMQNTTIVQNTIVASWWANNIGVYGGVMDLVANNLIMDSVKENGIGIGTFGPTGGVPRTAFVQGNWILRGGSFGYGFQYPAIELGGLDDPTRVNNILVRGNTIIDPMWSGILINDVENTLVDGNIIDAPFLDGIMIAPTAQGNASFVGNSVINLRPGETAFALTVPAFDATAHDNVSAPE
jgi:hypothetical protein